MKPTEQEIRAAVEAAWEEGGKPPLSWPPVPAGLLEDAIGFLGGFGTPESDPDGDWLWHNLRETEDDRLMQLISDAKRQAEDECRRIITEAIVGALRRFAEEYPEAPRAKSQLVGAGA